MMNQLQRLLQIKVRTEVSNRVIFVDDINRKVLRRHLFSSGEGDTTYFGELEDFPYSHHIS